jgi:5-hydroxyisourate hydrolase-like protein (transthyretin family)
MEKAPAGAVAVWASETSSAGAERSTRAQELTLPPGTETEIVLEFTEGLVVTGHVMREGAPVADVRVSFRALGVSVLEASARTDGDGRYEVMGLEPGRYRISAWGQNVSYSTEYTVAGYDELDIDVTGAALSGVVLDASSGSPLADAFVSLWRRGPGENTPDKSMTSNANGEFAAPSLAEGSYRVVASMEGFGQEVREVDLRRDDPVEVVLELEASDGLTLEVVDARDGRPLEATVVVRDVARRIVANRHSGVGADGRLTIPLAPGQYLLSTSADGYGTVTRPVAAPGTGLSVGLTPGGTLVLESERALHGRIRLVGSDGEEYVRCWCNGLADIDLEGRRTTVENVTPGRYTLEVIEEVGMSAVALTVAIREGQISRVALD